MATTPRKKPGTGGLSGGTVGGGGSSGQNIQVIIIITTFYFLCVLKIRVPGCTKLSALSLHCK
jgi:hypothetical protein